MSPAPTESRIFADRYSREARRLEKLHAAKLAPGQTSWGGALRTVCERMRKSDGPVKQVTILRNTVAYLKSVAKEDKMFIMLNNYSTKRSAAFHLATIDFSEHPLEGVNNEDGVNVVQHIVRVRRDGSARYLLNSSIAYISRHAVQRLHEREDKLTNFEATKMFTAIGLLGFLLGYSDKHDNSGVALHLGDTVAVGSFKEAVGGQRDDVLCRFFEVRTMLPTEDVEENNPTLLANAKATMAVLGQWIEDRDRSKELVKLIPVFPSREDYASRKAITVRVPA